MINPWNGIPFPYDRIYTVPRRAIEKVEKFNEPIQHFGYRVTGLKAFCFSSQTHYNNCLTLRQVGRVV